MNSREVFDPHKVFVKFLPWKTTKNEVELFLSTCGKIKYISLKEPKIEQPYSDVSYMYGFITFETQAAADRAVFQLNGSVMRNSLGKSQKISVVHATARPSNSRHQEESSKNEQEKESLKQYNADEERIKQIYNNPAEEQEILELQRKVDELEARQKELRQKNDAIIEGNELLRFQIDLQDLERENEKLKDASN